LKSRFRAPSLDESVEEEPPLHLFFDSLKPDFSELDTCKYRYRKGPKNNFAEAKQAAIQFLNACPLDVLRRFINRSWRFMNAYRMGLNGEAAAWAVRKQKQHRSISQTAMYSILAVHD